jgi:hypothetical protein
MEVRHAVLAAALVNTLVASSGVIFGGAALGISLDVLALTGAALSYATAAAGLLVDWERAGPRATASAGTLLSAAGFLSLALDGSPGGDGILALTGLILVCSGGTGTYLAGFCASNVQSNPALWAAALTGLYTFSGLDATLLQLVGGSGGDDDDGEGGGVVGIDSAACLVLAGFQLVALLLVRALYPSTAWAPGDRCRSEDVPTAVLLAALGIAGAGEGRGAAPDGTSAPDGEAAPGGDGAGPNVHSTPPAAVVVGRRHSFSYEPSTQPEPPLPPPADGSVGAPPKLRRSRSLDAPLKGDLVAAAAETRPYVAHGIVPPSFWRGQRGGRLLVARLRSRADATFAWIFPAGRRSGGGSSACRYVAVDVDVATRAGAGQDVDVLPGPTDACATRPRPQGGGAAQIGEPQLTLQAKAVSLAFWGVTLWYTLHLALMVHYFFSVAFSRGAVFAEWASWLGNGLPGLLGPAAGVIFNRCGLRASLLAANAAAVGMLCTLVLESDVAAGSAAAAPDGAGATPSALELGSLLCFCAHRTLIFALFFTFMGQFCGGDYGKLVGLATVVAGTVGLFAGPVMETMLEPSDMLLLAGVGAASSVAALAL